MESGAMLVITQLDIRSDDLAQVSGPIADLDAVSLHSQSSIYTGIAILIHGCLVWFESKHRDVMETLEGKVQHCQQKDDITH